MIRRCIAALALAGGLAAAAAHAAPPPPLSPSLHAFPGDFPSPTSAVSAGLALADRWLGDRPGDNPAVAPRREAGLSPMLLRVSRQDLRRENRRVDEQPAFFDAAGVWAVLEAGPVSLSVYGLQPLVRLEDTAFLRGRASDPLNPPATIAANASTRELRGGLAVSYGGDRVRLGVAAEWTQREDRYEVAETSGAPTQDVRAVELSGGGLGGQTGARVRVAGDGGAGTVEAGLAVRWIPALTLDVTVEEDLLTGAASSQSETERGGALEGGATLAWSPTAAFRVLAAASGRGEQSWDGFGLVSGAGSGWRLAGEYHDRRDPWTVRFGYGADEQRGVPEPRASLVGLGVGRVLRRPGQPNSTDDRVLVSVIQPF
jgi:hypothetical protein